MMQQPIYQQEQQGTQDQGGQQMVLCPVRLVYETQMLVQPNDQIQPNQTILINPQNTPPWIQNRQVQNQVIYVQQVPTNYIPSPQPHVDQNQLYIQNYGYQNIPQMYIQNPQEQIRPLQMVPNMVPNMTTNIGAIQNQRMVSNVTPMPQSLNLVNAVPTQNVTANRMITPNQIATNEIISKPQEAIPQNAYRHQMAQQIQQDPRFPIQPTITMLPNTVQNVQRLPQGFEPNVNQIRPLQQNVAPNVQNVYPNTIFNIDENRKTNAPGTKGNNFNIVNPIPVAKSAAQTYKPIQPRSNQTRNSAPNLLPIQSSNSTQHSMPNSITINNVPRKILPNNVMPVPNTPNASLGNVKVENNNFVFNRKRKSESPDEVHKRLSVTSQGESTIIIKPIANETRCGSADVGVNTSPIHRASGRITINNLQITPLNPNIPNSKLIEELAKPVRSQQQITETQTTNKNVISIIPSENVADALQTDKDKLVRNTVYVQARGRILADKGTMPDMPKIEATTSSIEPNITLPNVNEEPLKVVKEENINETKKEITCTTSTPSNTIEDNKSNIKEEKLESTPVKQEDTEVKTKEESKSNINIKKESSNATNIQEDRAYILTHVLGGFVIQESNVAFPIRKPLKEKTFFSNTEESKTDNYLNRDREFVKDNSKIIDISHLNIQECENLEGNTENSANTDDKDNPFKLLKPSDVKAWTAQQLATHLAGYADWSETVTVLQDHELDGESLLLVSKAQLITIGIKEEHAETINEFVKG